MSDVIIIGGGLIGMLSALELADGGMQVTIIERGEVGRESSWAGGGILSPLYPWQYPPEVNELALWSHCHYDALVESLREHTGIDPELQRCGLLVLDAEEQQNALNWAREHAMEAESLSAGQIQETEPQLVPIDHQAVLFPQIGQVRNPRLLQSVHRRLEQLGVKFLQHQPVQGLELKAGRVTGVRLANSVLEADYYVIAAGAWSAALLADAGMELAIRPVKGQMLLYQLRPNTIKHVVLSGGKYVIPRRDGHVLVGSTMEESGFEKEVTSEAKSELHRFFTTLFPVFGNERPIKQWAGLRPGSVDGIPIIGKVEQAANLYVNTGHFRNGVIMGPASAVRLADAIFGTQRHGE